MWDPSCETIFGINEAKRRIIYNSPHLLQPQSGSVLLFAPENLEAG